MATAEHTHDGHDHGHHITPKNTLTGTFLILTGLMVATIVAARLPYMGVTFLYDDSLLVRLITNGIAIGIALLKAALVVQIFMGVKFGTKLVKFYAYGGFIWFLTMSVILIDYFSRPWEPVQGWEAAPASALPRNASQPDGTNPDFIIQRPEHGGKDHGGEKKSGEH